MCMRRRRGSKFSSRQENTESIGFPSQDGKLTPPPLQIPTVMRSRLTEERWQTILAPLRIKPDITESRTKARRTWKSTFRSVSHFSGSDADQWSAQRAGTARYSLSFYTNFLDLSYLSW